MHAGLAAPASFAYTLLPHCSYSGMKGHGDVDDYIRGSTDDVSLMKSPNHVKSASGKYSSKRLLSLPKLGAYVKRDRTSSAHISVASSMDSAAPDECELTRGKQ